MVCASAVKRDWCMTSVAAIAGLLGILCATQALAEEARAFSLPSGGTPARWEAERARSQGSWRSVQHSWAGGGAYVKPAAAAGDAVLEFPFECNRPATLRLWPVWWRHGSRESAKRFPYPLAAVAGPDVLGQFEGRVFFTAPAAGRVVVFDPRAGCVAETIDVGGYPADLIVEKNLAKVFVADAARDRVVVLDARRPSEGIRSVAVPKGPWSLALSHAQLYVACREGKALAVIGGKESRLLKTVALDARPIHVANINPPRRTLAVWPEVKTFDMLTLEPIPAHKEQYPPVGRRRSASLGKGQSVDVPRPHTIRIRSGGKTQLIDVRSVTATGSKATGNAGPDVLDACSDRVFFTSPATGRVGVVDVKAQKLVKCIEVGGRPTDLVAHRPRHKVYVADSEGGRIVVLDAKTLTVAKVLKVPAQPCSLALVHDVATQRTSVQPYQVQKLFVACRKGRAMVVVDVATDEIVSEADLPGEPVQVKAAPLPNPGWWPLLADREMPLALRPRLVVRMAATAFDAATLQPVAGVSIPERFSKSRSVRVPVTAAKAQSDAPDPLTRPRYGAPRLSAKVDGDLGEWAKTTPVPLPLSPKATSLDSYPGWKGKGDLSGQFYMGWDDKHLYFAAAVTDDTFHQPHASDMIWEADCIQIAFDLLRNGSYDREYGLALSAGEPFKWCWYGPGADAAKIKLAVKRRPRGVDYEAAIPWEILKPLTPGKGRVFGFTAAVMDSDGAEREGCAQWTPGIVDGKDPLAFGAVALLDEQSPDALAAALTAPAATPPDRVATVSGGNDLMLRVDKTWVDVSAATDPQLAPTARPLEPADRPGAITLSMDAGPAHDYTRDLWITPDQNLLLVNGSEEYWRWNAPRFTVPKGRHVLKVRAHSPSAQIDAIEVARTLEQHVELFVEPLPSSNHGIFYDTEPVRFMVEIRNRQPQAQSMSLHWSVRNYMDEVVRERKVAVALPDRRDWRPTPVWGDVIAPELKDNGHHTLTIRVDSPDGDLARSVRFLRLPKLEHPRLLFRKEEIAKVRARIQQRPDLYRRYLAWLRRRCSVVEEYYPGRFLPLGLTRESSGKAAPADLKDKRRREQTYGWRMFELGWRLVACQFASMFLEPADEAFFESKVRPYLEETAAGRVGGFCTYHHHGPFFPGAVASLYDMAAMESEDTREKVGKFFERYRGSMDRFPYPLVALEEPLTVGDRALVSEITMWQVNMERYFSVHCGRRGGTWWLNPWTYCQCPLQGVFLSFLYCRNVFDEPRLFEKDFFRGFVTFHRYVEPRGEKGRLFPMHRGPSGEPFQWMLSSLSRHPLQKRVYGWDEWVRKLEGKLNDPEEKAVDELMNLGGMPFVGPLHSRADHFVTGLSVPLALAFGWYTPGSAEAGWEEMPPTTLFDVEGWACMRSGWGPDATQLAFISGVRDHTYRHQPTHFSVMKAGEFLIGTSALHYDDGNCQPCWANAVTVGEDWLDRWRINLQHKHPRQMEHCLINRFSPSSWRYVARDRALLGYSPAEGGWGGGLDLHGHTQSLFVKEGDIVAYETWPEFDYVAGDATNAWPVEQVHELYRQLVYVKPDAIVMYDRVKLARAGVPTRWMACTAPGVSTGPRGFKVQRGESVLHGSVLLPAKSTFATPKPYRDFVWKGQKVLEIRPSDAAQEVEYLVVMNVGNESVAPLAAKLTSDSDTVRVDFKLGKQAVSVRLLRRGPVGGHIAIAGGPRPIDRELVQKIDDSYRHWNTSPHFKKWMTNERFAFVIPEHDRKAFSSPK